MGCGNKEKLCLIENEEHNQDSDTDHDDCEEYFLSDIEEKIEPMDEIEETNQTSMFANKYTEDINLPTVANKLADIIVELEKNRHVNPHNNDDFIHEYKDLPLENEENQLNQIFMPADEISKDDGVNMNEELYNESHTLPFLNPEDEINFSCDKSENDDYGSQL